MNTEVIPKVNKKIYVKDERSKKGYGDENG